MAVNLTPERPEVEIEGSGGLRLRLRIDKYASMTWLLQASKTKFFEHGFLEVIDAEGKLWIGEGTKGLAVGVLADKERLRFELVKLVDRIVSGGGLYDGLGAVIEYRERSAKSYLKVLEMEAAKIPAAREELEKTQAASGWLKEMADLAELEGANENIREVAV